VYGFIVVFFSNVVSKMHDIQLQKCPDLENRVRCPSRSLKMSPLDRAHDFLLMFYSNYGSISIAGGEGSANRRPITTSSKLHKLGTGWSSGANRFFCTIFGIHVVDGSEYVLTTP